jgi:hypothetical protein
MAKKVAASKRPQAERAAEWACAELFNCIYTRRALRTKFAKVDFFGCDIIGVRKDGSRVWVQVTAGQTAAVLVRRKKLEVYPWHPTDRVFVWQLVERDDIANPRKKEWFFRVWEYGWEGWMWRCGEPKKWVWWGGHAPIPIKPEWFKARQVGLASEDQ